MPYTYGLVVSYAFRIVIDTSLCFFLNLFYPSTNHCLEQVRVLTTDARLLEGVLAGFDKSTNVILLGCSEWIIGGGDDAQEIELGVYMIRGDSVVCVGEVESKVDWATFKTAYELKGTKNPL